MSDPNDDDSLFSQDDIDKLLNAQSLEEAEDSIANKGGDIDQISSEDVDDDDIIGELSQDDIDRLMNAVSAPDEDILPQVQDTTPSEDEAPDLEDGDDDDDLGELSQDDIERMLSSTTSEDNDTNTPGIDDNIFINNREEEDGGAFDLISQDDIDKLMATDDMPDSDIDELESMGSINADETDDFGLDELENSILSPGKGGGVSDASKSDNIAGKEEIDPSEAWNIEDCLITQDTVDALLSRKIEEENLSEQEPFQVNLSEDEPDPDFDLDSNDEITGSDLDNLLNDGEMDDLLNDISQDDIDGFLQESDAQTSYDAQALSGNDADLQVFDSSKDGGDDSVKNIISQNDIDALLAGTDEEDEDILADMDISDISTPVQGVQSSLPEDDSQVILESPDYDADKSTQTLAGDTVRELADLMDVEKEKPVKSRFVLKIIIVIFVVLTLMAGCVAGLYFLFFKDKVDQLLSSSQTQTKTEDTGAVKPEVPDMNIQESQELTPDTITLENFMVLTPNRQDGITYISVDISIEYSKSTIFDPINSRLPYYRGVIYDAINEALKSDKGDKITESELLEKVKGALNQSFSDMKLNKVAFVNFKTG